MLQASSDLTAEPYHLIHQGLLLKDPCLETVCSTQSEAFEAKGPEFGASFEGCLLHIKHTAQLSTAAQLLQR